MGEWPGGAGAGGAALQLCRLLPSELPSRTAVFIVITFFTRHREALGNVWGGGVDICESSFLKTTAAAESCRA